MKTIGLIGGMSWESTLLYYRGLNEKIQCALGGWHSAKILLYSVNFQEIVEMQNGGEWEKAGEKLGGIAAKLEQADCDFVVLCTNTMHHVAERIQSRISVPLLHIAEATADAILDNGCDQTLLLGTRFTMEKNFYKNHLARRGIRVSVPSPRDIEKIHAIIYNELCKGKVEKTSQSFALDLLNRSRQEGCQSVVLGCTELILLFQDLNSPLPLFDTTEIHIHAVAEKALHK